MRVWVLNLDAEHELAHRGGAYTAPARVRLQLAAHAARFAALLPDGDVVLDSATFPEGTPGAAWCPTPSAIAALERAGAVAPPAPPTEVLREVNGRAFAHRIAALEEDRLCEDLAALEAALARPGDWLLKRALSFAGRGQLKVCAGTPAASYASWARGALAQGPVLVTPLVDITLEVALHGELTAGLRRGALTVQRVDPHGQHLGSELAGDDALTSEERRALDAAFEASAAALIEAGYFGPFGIDAFRYRDRDGGTRFHALSDLNARYSMGWPVGMRGA